jgi:3-hydroxyacyl-CoA dehydrogenase
MTNEIQTIAVIGAGDQGREIARAALLAGYRTILEDVSEGRLERAVAWLSDAARTGDQARSRLVLARTVEEAVREADLIIEAVADEMEMKLEMFTIFDKFARPGAIFVSTSATIPIAELADITFCPERCIGMRFASDAGNGSGVELVCAPQTSEETIAHCREVARRMGKDVAVTTAMDPGRQDAGVTRTD